ncbi:MAG: transcription-repair coupling factor [Peptostreptococcaceae bacterium]|nr:transcription-repair coupling factor [Peptostreptococcaceae bacterium]MDY5738843.1 transcription-repair coupling factor [Anaerovoracaceae bacterium]
MMNKGIVSISGVSESISAPTISKIAGEGQSLIIVANQRRAKELAVELSFFSEKKVLVLPAHERLFVSYEARNRDNILERLKILKALARGEDFILVASAAGAMKKLPPISSFIDSSIVLKRGDIYDIKSVGEKLLTLGYEPVSLVEEAGEFSIRGGILDIFTPDGEMPYRIEFFGDEIDSLRSFDKDSQRSLENLSFVEIFQARQILKEEERFKAAAKEIRKEFDRAIRNLEKQASSDEDKEKYLRPLENLAEKRNVLCNQIENMLNVDLMENYIHYFYNDTVYLWEYLRDEADIFVEEPGRIYETIDNLHDELKDDLEVLIERGMAIPKDAILIPEKEEFFEVYNARRTYILMAFPKACKGVDALAELRTVNGRQMSPFNGRMELLQSEVRRFIKKKYTIHIVMSTKEKLDNIKEFFERNQIIGNILYDEGVLNSGVDLLDEKICYICEKDIFGLSKNIGARRKKKASKKKEETFFSDLKPGDYVVHENHGIGKFIGIKQISIEGEKKDYLSIKYAGNDALYVPVEQMDFVQKYVGSEGITPKINKLTGGEWKLTKAKAKAAIAEMASELIDLYAKRKLEPGYAFSKDSVWQKEFEDSFPYEETDDQLRAIAEIKKDMEEGYSMDRLLCGDVGFGKTEVAARAIFKCLSEGKQAAVLVPTTILANQHYYTLKDRFEHFPMSVEMLSRFRSPKEQEKIIEKVKAGKIDLLIGTHRMLSEDIKFKDLGLLCIDEEQRFGVSHKEKIKKLKAAVDVLTLSATPIPRTLNMSLSGIKEMSLISEPPEERLPVQTYVLEEDDYILQDIIERELDRGGQVFVVYNKVKGIISVADKIRGLIPDARVAVGHGQMNEHALENVMIDFVNGETQILVCTTIIETGIDIPNANTMIILNADSFGLSQLYQLRGRVGRSSRLAYAYLMHQKGKVLTEIAEKRLKAIRDFTEFGSGFKIAMRDLEIRGAGNILGAQQSGHMMNIGYELYCKLIDDAVKALKGEVVKERKEELSIDLVVTAGIPSWYIADEQIKLSMYKKIACICDDDSLDEVFDELLDRFGDVPRETENLLLISHIRSIAQDLGVKRVYESQGKVMIAFEEKNLLKGKALIEVSEAFPHKVIIYGRTEPYIKLTTDKQSKIKDVLKIMKIIKGKEMM